MSRQIRFHDREFKDHVERTVTRGLDRMSETCAEEARSSMGGAKSGRWYYRRSFGAHWLGDDHDSSEHSGLKLMPARSSAPGEAPAVQFGMLQSSIGWEAWGRLGRRVGSNSKVGRWMETGTKKIKPRPWLIPALQNVWSRWESFFKWT